MAVNIYSKEAAINTSLACMQSKYYIINIRFQFINIYSIELFQPKMNPLKPPIIR